MSNLKIFLKVTVPTLIGFLGLNLGQLQASVTTFGCDADSNPICTLQELFDGGSILIDNGLFSQWDLLSVNATGQVPDFSLVEVIPLNSNPNELKLSYQFNGQLTVSDLNILDLQLAFNLATISNTVSIEGTSLEIADFSFAQSEGGAIDILEEIFDNSNQIVAGLSVFAENDDSELFDSVQFEPQSSLSLETSFFLVTDEENDMVALNTFEQSFYQIQTSTDEPSFVLSFVILGLLGLGWAFKG
ncbi:MAG: hypothetical protein AB4058_04065 [Microcystaceae cyanobacterium]